MGGPQSRGAWRGEGGQAEAIKAAGGVRGHLCPRGLSLSCRVKTLLQGTSLVVQWLRVHLPMHGMWVWSLVRELRSHTPHSN